jgi:uncharacterized protein YjbI with pentapeptide repeats
MNEHDLAGKWGDPICEAQQAELQGYLDHWNTETEHGKRKSPFDGVELTGADVFWLATETGRDDSQDVSRYLPNLHLEGAILLEAHLEGADLRGAHLEGAILRFAHLEQASLLYAHLASADLFEAHLEGANLARTSLEQANLSLVHLEGADLTEAHLEGADLRAAYLDAATTLDSAVLGNGIRESVALADVRWGGVNVTTVDWSRVRLLGDELSGRRSRATGERHRRWEQYRALVEAVRAYRQVAAVLRSQGLLEDGNRFDYRGLVLQRRTFLLSGRIPQRIFSAIQAMLTGYGYRTPAVSHGTSCL